MILTNYLIDVASNVAIAISVVSAVAVALCMYQLLLESLESFNHKMNYKRIFLIMSMMILFAAIIILVPNREIIEYIILH